MPGTRTEAIDEPGSIVEARKLSGVRTWRQSLDKRLGFGKSVQRLGVQSGSRAQLNMVSVEKITRSKETLTSEEFGRVHIVLDEWIWLFLKDLISEISEVSE